MWSKEEIDILMNNIERYLKVPMIRFSQFSNWFTGDCKNSQVVVCVITMNVSLIFITED